MHSKIMTRGYLRFFLLPVFFLSFSPILNAQTTPLPADTVKLVEYAFVPAISFNSDIGLIVGGQGNRYDYSSGFRPYTSFLNSTAVVSTRGLFFFEVKYDKPQNFGKNIRTTFAFSIGRFFDDNFFGVANNAEIVPPPANNPDIYNFRSFTTDFLLDVRFRLKKYTGNRRLEFLASSDLVYETPFDNPPNRLISQAAPRGINGGVSHLLSAGAILERRDDEIRPTRGTFTRFNYGFAAKPIGSSFNFTSGRLDNRFYFPISNSPSITFANRLLFQQTSGSVPYWRLSALGGQDRLRGFPVRRFLDNNYIALNTEIRAWLGRMPIINTEYGFVLFSDSGRTFNNDQFDEILSDYKTTVGLGFIMSLFTPDFFIRWDLAYSEEEIGFYIGTGFLF